MGIFPQPCINGRKKCLNLEYNDAVLFGHNGMHHIQCRKFNQVSDAFGDSSQSVLICFTGLTLLMLQMKQTN
jgi:hypothetical protein